MSTHAPRLKEPIPLPIHDIAKRRRYYRIAGGVALAAFLFSLFVGGWMIFRTAQDWRESPLIAAEPGPARPNSAKVVQEYRVAKIALAAQPQDENAKQKIRELDLVLRSQYFDRHGETDRAAWLLLAGLVVLLLALKAQAQWGEKTAGVMQVFDEPADPWHAMTGIRTAIVVGGLLMTAGLFALGFARAPIFVVNDSSTSTAPSTAPAPAVVVTLQERLKHWPSFRGPLGCGIAPDMKLPADWDGAAGRNILWKTPVPLPGANSPIVWGGKVFLSGASENVQEVFCFDGGTGALLWRKPVKGPVKEVTVNEETGYAACTLATDGVRVYAIFPTGDIAAFDFAGNNVWTKNLGKPESQYGFAASLATFNDRVIVQFDQGHEEKDGKSAMLALEGATGNQLWKTRRYVTDSWASPIVIYPEKAAPQIVATGRPWVVGYDAETGKELWKASVMEGDVAPSPAFAGNRIFVANEQAKLASIKIDGTGDVTKSHVVWSAEDGLPDMVSPLATDDFVLLVNGSGTATCYAASDGAKRWEQDLDAGFHASPIIVGKAIYLVNTDGVTHIFEAGAAFKPIAKAPLGEAVSATPAFVDGRIYIRGKTNLYCIGAGGGEKK